MPRATRAVGVRGGAMTAASDVEMTSGRATAALAA